MSNPLRAPTNVIAHADLVPSAYFTGDTKDINPRYSLDEVVEFYKRQRFPMRNSVLIPAHLSVDSERLSDGLAIAQGGGVQFVRRSGSAFRVNKEMWKTLHDKSGPFSKAMVGAAMSDKFMVSASTQLTRGRLLKYYVGNFAGKHLQPPTVEEVSASMRDSGCVFTGGIPAPYAVAQGPHDPPGLEYVKINLDSDNGYPVGGRGITEGAMERVLLLSKECRRLLDSVAGAVQDPVEQAIAVENEVYEWHDSRPHMVLVKGKCKQDYYTEAKLRGGMMRFYNALPRQLALLMQQATQPFEAQVKGLFDDHTLHSAQKITLVRGGAHELVRVLDEQLVCEGRAYVHVGDDSWVVYREDLDLIFTALDCSCFDLTQHKSVSLPVHRAFRDLLAQIDPVAAGVWMAFMRKRLVVIEKTVTVLMEHGGPSGTPMQSKVNDVLMDILIKRFLKAVTPGLDEAGTNRVMQTVGERLGFVVRVEQFRRVRASSVAEALKQFPFLFIGYYFHNTSPNGFVYPFVDLPRSMSQMAYPSGKWESVSSKFANTEAMRLTSIAMGSGIAPTGQHCQEALFQECSRLLIEAVSRMGSAVHEVDERLRWATQTAAHAMGEDDVREFSASVSGLRRAFAEGAGVLNLWRHPDDTPKIVYTVDQLKAFKPAESELPFTTVMVPLSQPVMSLFPSVTQPSVSSLFIPRGVGQFVSDLIEDAMDTVERPRPADIESKTLGRMPRQSKETAAARFRRIGQQHKLRAQLRRTQEALAQLEGIAGSADINERRSHRARMGLARAGAGSRQAARSAEDAEAKDLRRKGGSGKKGGRRRK